MDLASKNSKPKKVGLFVFHPPDESGDVYVEHNYYPGEWDRCYFTKQEAQELLKMWD